MKSCTTTTSLRRVSQPVGTTMRANSISWMPSTNNTNNSRTIQRKTTQWRHGRSTVLNDRLTLRLKRQFTTEKMSSMKLRKKMIIIRKNQINMLGNSMIPTLSAKPLSAQSMLTTLSDLTNRMQMLGKFSTFPKIIQTCLSKKTHNQVLKRRRRVCTTGKIAGSNIREPD